MASASKLNQEVRDTVSHSVSSLASSSSKDARALRSGAALREALLELLDETQFEQITIRDICAQAGVHYATFFRHYSDKESLLADIAKKQTERLSQLAMQVKEASDYQSGWHALCAYVDDHRELWARLLNGGAGSAMREEWVRQARLVGVSTPPINSWLPHELGVTCAATLIAEALAWWLSQPRGAYSVDDMAELMNRLLRIYTTPPE